MSQRYIIAILAVVLALFALACGGEDGGDGKSQPARRSGPNAVQNQAPEPGANQPGPVQGDPSAHDTHPGDIELQAIWESETSAKPQIEYSIGGGQIPAGAGSMTVNKHGNRYIGVWTYPVPAQSGVTYGLTMFGTASFKTARCVILYHGQFPNAQEDRRNCAASWRVP